MLHFSDGTVKKLLCDIMSYFIELRHVRECNPFTLDIHDKRIRVPIHQVYVGMSATETLTSSSISSDIEGIRKFKESCMSFLVEFIDQIRSRFITSHLAFLEFLSPQNALARVPSSLAVVFSSMPFLKDLCNKERADLEWRQLALDGKFQAIKDISEFWKKTLQQTDVNGDKKYSNLSKVVGCAMSLPHSNASVERTFSHLRWIKTDQRNSLKNASLVSLLHTKYGLKTKGISSH